MARTGPIPLLFLLGAAGCFQTPAPPPAVPADGVADGGPAGGPEVDDGRPEPPDCEHAKNHCLAPGTYFVARRPWQRGFQFVEAATVIEGNGGGDSRSFVLLRTGEELATRWYWRTRVPRAKELAVGQMAIMLYRRRDGRYVPPDHADHAKGRWWLSRIVDVSRAEAGLVLVAGGHEVWVENIRLLEGDDRVAVTRVDDVDAHFVAETQWFVGERPLPERRYEYVDAAAPLVGEREAGVGQFLSLRTGEVVRTEHAWPTRIATRAEVVAGAHVFMLHVREEGKYVAPAGPREAYGERWWVSKVVDASEYDAGTVVLEGGYRVASSAVRVAVEE